MEECFDQKSSLANGKTEKFIKKQLIFKWLTNCIFLKPTIENQKEKNEFEKTATFFPVKIACISMFLDYVSSS